jgi:hypothetical protein
MFKVFGLAAAAGRHVGAAFRAFMARRAMRPLASMDDRMLRDIGLTRADVIHCFSSPWSSDGFDRLTKLNDERRQRLRPVHSSRRPGAEAAERIDSLAA